MTIIINSPPLEDEAMIITIKDIMKKTKPGKSGFGLFKSTGPSLWKFFHRKNADGSALFSSSFSFLLAVKDGRNPFIEDHGHCTGCQAL